jgi:hypothetical protein
MCLLGSQEDRDGDGWVGNYCDGVLTIGGPDCDDTDPGQHAIAYRDRDGDGVGNLDETTCAVEGVAPGGYTLVAGDCDDSDAERSPRWLDPPGDGIDQNCDGHDAALCTADAIECPCNLLGSATPTGIPSCHGSDLTLVAAAYCGIGCGPEGYVELANLGSLDFSGDITFIQGSTIQTVRGSIGSGALTAPFHVPDLDFFQELTVSIAPEIDCNPENDLYEGGARREPAPPCR